MTLARSLLVAPLALAALTACTEKDGEVAGDDSAVDTASELHPLVPPGYEYRWDTDGCGADGDAEAIYVLAEATTDADQQITVTERWYHFYGGERSDDCIDTFTYTGGPITDAELNGLNASEAEEGYDTTRTLTEDNCSEWGTGDAPYTLIFDTLSPSGNLNYENAMLVFRYYEGFRGWTLDTDYAIGVFNPEGEALAPPASYTWEAEFCNDGTSW